MSQTGKLSDWESGINKIDSTDDEIANDLIQIITVYTAKINGMRKYKKPVIM